MFAIMYRHIASLLLLLTALVAPSIGATEMGPFRPPAVPLVTIDPYTSVWSFSDQLHESWPVHWTGAAQAMAGMIRVDGKTHRFMGPKNICSTAARQTSLAVAPTTTRYVFVADGVELSVTFITPMLPSDLRLLASPVTYLAFEVKALDGKPHKVKLYFDASGEWVINDAKQEIVWQRLAKPIGGMQFMSMGSAEQPILAKSGDNRRIDWGYLHVGVPTGADNQLGVMSHNVRSDFADSGQIPSNDDTAMPRPANENWPVIATVLDLGTVTDQPVERLMVLAYDDIFSIEYMGQKLRPWWAKEFRGFQDMVCHCIKNYPAIRQQCEAFDAELLADARQLGGQAYERLIAISYRHTWASGKIVISPDGSEPWYFHKECFSNGCMATVDVSYPAAPFFALFSPTLLNGMAAPVFDYAARDEWPFPFAPHDVGQYPKGNGQVYSLNRETGKLTIEHQMPIEECGNMILMAAAAAKAAGNADYAATQWKLLTQWAEYLKNKGLDPENQLCTDDFTGHLAHNTNLSLKAINAIGGYAMLCDMRGLTAEAAEYRAAAKEMATQWPTMANDGDHYRLAFDRPGTWSMKYNLVWDSLLDLDLFAPEVARKEVAFYLKTQNEYGLPLDNRADFTKSDWLVWSATLAEKQSDFEKLIVPLYRFVNESPDRVPFSDWYFTSTAKVRGFRARPVIGGVFIKFLTDPALWAKWAQRSDTIEKAETTGKTYVNPVIDEIGPADPTVILFEGTYYLYPTDDNVSYHVYTSKDLVHWTKGRRVFEPGQRNVWAPDIFRDPKDGKFYLYYTVDKRIGVAVADKPDGTFIDRATFYENAIDAHMFCDDDGQYTLYYVQLPGFRIHAQRMKSPLERQGDPIEIIRPTEPWEKKSGDVTEGPWMLKHQGTYYLLYSGTGANSLNYAIGYASANRSLAISGYARLRGRGSN